MLRHQRTGALWSSPKASPNTSSSEHQDWTSSFHKHLTLTHDALCHFLPLLTWYLGSLPGRDGGNRSDLGFGFSFPFWQGEWAPLGMSPNYSVPLFPHLRYRMGHISCTGEIWNARVSIPKENKIVCLNYESLSPLLTEGNCSVTHKIERWWGPRMSPGARLVMYSSLSVSDLSCINISLWTAFHMVALIPLRPDLLALVDAKRTSVCNQEPLITCFVSKYPERYSP